MKEVVLVIATILLFFGGSILVSYCVFWYFAAKQSKPNIRANSSVRLVGPGGSYRCHFLRHDDDSLVFSSPLQADRYVPVRVGEKLLVSAESDGALMTFRVEVSKRDAESHELWTTLPNYVRRTERRTVSRSASLAGEDLLIQGELAEVVDHSSHGLCLLTVSRPQLGSVVRVSLPSHGIDALAWVVESVPEAFGSKSGYRLHLQFQEEQTFMEKRAHSHAFAK